MPNESTYDAIIIGGGPAGLTCAIFLCRYRRRVLVCDSGKGRNYASRAIPGFLGQHGIHPEELRRRGRAEAEEAGVEFCDCTATKVERVGASFEVTTTSGGGGAGGAGAARARIFFSLPPPSRRSSAWGTSSRSPRRAAAGARAASSSP